MAQNDKKSKPQNDYTLVPTGPDEDNMDVDDMLALAGDFGRLQYLMMIMFSIVNIFCAFHYFAQTYISIVPEFWCKGSDHLQCQDNENATTCEAGWDYNLTGGFNTVVSELNWVCGHSWYASWGQSPYFVGSVFGTLILGFVADWKGRIPVLVISYLFAFIGNFVTAFSYHLPEFMLGRALAGIATDSNFFMMYIIVMEYMRPDMRTFGLNLCIGVFYCIGCVVSPWLALFSGDWRYFLFGISAPMLLVPALAFLLPESAGWLINKGRIEDAVLRFNRIAKINGKEPLTQSAIDRFRATAEKRIPVQTTSNGIFSLVKLFGLVKTPRLRKHTILLVIKTMALCLVYDAISRNVDGTEFNPFILSSISSLTIFPSCLVILFLQDKVGRKAMASVSLLLSGLFIGTEGVIQATMGNHIDSYTTVVLDIIGRFAVNIAYNSGTQYAAELIPTEVRGQGVAFIHVVGYVATTASPFLLTLKRYWNAIPGLIMGSLAIAGAACCLHLPETMDKTLPLTLEDGENFGEGEGMWDFACFKKKSKVLTVE